MQHTHAAPRCSECKLGTQRALGSPATGLVCFPKHHLVNCEATGVPVEHCSVSEPSTTQAGRKKANHLWASVGVSTDAFLLFN
jgi:hypothetical protein